MSLPNRLIVDTSVLIDYLRGRPGFPALETVSEIYLPAMVLAELQVGWLALMVRHTDRSGGSRTLSQ
jgi:predicted nucleic acid-binding protein